MTGRTGLRVAAMLLFAALCGSARPSPAADPSWHVLERPPREVVQIATTLGAMLNDQFGSVEPPQYLWLAAGTHPRPSESYLVLLTLDGWGGFADCCDVQYLARVERVTPLKGDLVDGARYVLVAMERFAVPIDFAKVRAVTRSRITFATVWHGPDDARCCPSRKGTIEVDLATLRAGDPIESPR